MCCNLGWLVYWHCSSFNFAKRWHFVFFLSVYVSTVGLPTLACNVRVFAKAGNSLLVCPIQMPIEKLNYKITTKSSKEFRPLEPLLIANCSRLFQRQALLAAILLLCVCTIIFPFNLFFLSPF